MARENCDPIVMAGEALLVQELNASLDKAVDIVKTMRPCRENSMVITKIEEAQMWLEKGVK